MPVKLEWTEGQKAYLKTLCEKSTKTLAEIGAIFCVSRNTVASMIKELGYERKSLRGYNLETCEDAHKAFLRPEGPLPFLHPVSWGMLMELTPSIADLPVVRD